MLSVFIMFEDKHRYKPERVRTCEKLTKIQFLHTDILIFRLFIYLFM